MASYSTVKYGAKGSAVSELQTLLNQNGYSLSVDGIFGDKTLAAVRDYQTRTGLSVDGIVGTNTWGALTGGGTGSTGGSYSGTGTTSTYSPTATVDYLAEADRYAGTKPTYTASDEQLEAKRLLEEYEANRPGDYVSGYQSQIDELLGKIQNRDPFSYDFNADPLYQQYKGNYLQLGQQAMMDTMGEASALTGGYGNSYAATAGNQTYQQYVQQVNNVIPELQNAAYQMYRDRGTDMYNEMGLLQGLENTAYGRYRDTYDDWTNDRDYYYGKNSDLYNRDYGEYMDMYNMWSADRDFGYQGAYDAQQQANWERDFAQTQSNWEAEYALAQMAKSGSGGSSGSSGSTARTSGAEMVGNKSVDELDEVAMNIYRNTGMQDPLKRVQSTGYTAAQKAYLTYAIKALIDG